MATAGGLEAATVDQARTPYGQIGDRTLNREFRNLDDPVNLDMILDTAQSRATSNFILDFNDDTAWIAFDLSTQAIKHLLAADDSNARITRWINIWYPYHSSSLLELLARRYDFSPRLLALMGSDPRVSRRSETSELRTQKHHRRSFWTRNAASNAPADVELRGSSDELTDHSSVSSYDSFVHGNLYGIIDDIWHYTSVDYGRSYVCVGYNSLYSTKNSADTAGQSILPHCARVWTWLLLCEDNTIISISEDPFPFSDGHLDPSQLRTLGETRRTILNVIRSLSSVPDHAFYNQHPMALLPIRMRLGNTPEETVHRDSDAPGLLFYYLFENWPNSYTLVTRRESRYGAELSRLRADMFESPNLHQIERLDTIGKELGVLRRHYQGYDRIIARLLEPSHATAASLQNSRVASEAGESRTSLDTVKLVVTQKESMLGVSLSSPAQARFRRLRDLIDLHALSVVDEYAKQKEALVAMNFNLIAIKESLDVERLTRITLLLTKATFMFLPVSLMTAYFSVQLVAAGGESGGSAASSSDNAGGAAQPIQYTVSQFWTAFAVLLFVSCSTLFVFGVFSGDVSTAVFIREVVKHCAGFGRRFQGKGRARGRG